MEIDTGMSRKHMEVRLIDVANKRSTCYARGPCQNLMIPTTTKQVF